jgi:hypothetical protein
VRGEQQEVWKQDSSRDRAAQGEWLGLPDVLTQLNNTADAHKMLLSTLVTSSKGIA